MPGRIEPLVSGEYYHVYNRAVEGQDIFRNFRDYRRFLYTFYYYQFSGPKPKFSNSFKQKEIIPKQNKKLQEIICYCLMPNHFHFLVQQLVDDGVSTFVRQLCNSYTKYFNAKYKRKGYLFQGVFKAVRIKNNEQLLHLSRYIHLNPIVSKITNSFQNYKWFSYREYALGEKLYCSTDLVLSSFPNRKSYVDFLEDQKDYGMTLEILKHANIDNI